MALLCGSCRTFPPLQSIESRRLHFRAAKTDPHGLACLEDHRDSAVAVCFLVVAALLCRSCLLCPLFSTTGAHGPGSAEIRGGAAVAVPPVVDVAVSCSDKCLATVEVPLIQFIAGVSGHFSRHRDRYAQLQLCMVCLVAAMRGSLLQFCSIFRPPSIWTRRPRAAGTPGV